MAPGGAGTRWQVVSRLGRWVRESAVVRRLVQVPRLLRAILDLGLLLLRVRLEGRRASRLASWSIADEWASAVRAAGPRPFVVCADASPRQLASVTYDDADALSDAFADWLLGLGARPGATVALLLPNSCEFVVALLGCAKAGCPAALINTDADGAALEHAIDSALGGEGAVFVVASRDLAPRVVSKPCHVYDAAEQDAGVVVFPLQQGRRCGGAMSGAPRASVRWDSVAAYIYTSGTSGSVTKACRITQVRAWAAGACSATLCRLGPADRVYCALPMYHATAGLLVLFGVVRSRCCVVVRSRFSASAFARDVDDTGATGCCYVGEMARYLVDHATRGGRVPAAGLRFAFGNGLPRECWADFERLFRIRQVVELYGSTEGNVQLFNNAGVAGACGLVPAPVRCLYPIFVARLAQDGDGDGPILLRDPKTGLCVEAASGEPGELLAAVDASGRNPARRFDGYANDPVATAHKVARGVRRAHDAFFRSGDLVAVDAFGFVYFVDRLGDTFRWKGQNVSTCEVAASVLTTAPALVEECVAYGVRVPRQPGRCGMVAVVLREDPPASWPMDLYAALDGEASLAPYATPRFLRVVRDLPKTTTHKYRKKDLAQDAFENCGTDAVFVRDPTKRAFVPLDARWRTAITQGDAHL